MSRGGLSGFEIYVDETTFSTVKKMDILDSGASRHYRILLIHILNLKKGGGGAGEV